MLSKNDRQENVAKTWLVAAVFPDSGCRLFNKYILLYMSNNQISIFDPQKSHVGFVETVEDSTFLVGGTVSVW